MPEGSGGARRLMILGAGGHAKVVIEVARAAGWEPVAALAPEKTGSVLGVPLRGGDDDAPALWRQGLVDAAAVAIGDNRLRRRLAKRLRGFGCPLPVLVHPAATISPTARLGEGTVVMAGAVVNADAVIGRDCIVNTGAVVEHDCVLGDGVHAAPRSVMGGSCRFGDLALFGIGASARPGVTVGEAAIVGAGAVVVRDIADAAVVGGAPARPIARR